MATEQLPASVVKAYPFLTRVLANIFGGYASMLDLAKAGPQPVTEVPLTDEELEEREARTFLAQSVDTGVYSDAPVVPLARLGYAEKWCADNFKTLQKWGGNGIAGLPFPNDGAHGKEYVQLSLKGKNARGLTTLSELVTLHD